MTAAVTKPRDDDDEDSGPPPPPDGGWGWMVVFGSFMIHIVTDGVTYSFGVFYNEFLRYFQEGESKTSWILSLLVGVTLCSGPISSAFVNKYGCRPVTIAGALLASSCLIASYFAQNVTVLFFTVGIGTGLGFGLIYLPAIVSVTMYFEKRRSLATGIAVCGSGLGTFIFAPFISKLMFEYGWRGSILIISAIVLECILFGALFRPLEDESDKTCSSNKKSLSTKEGNLDIHVSEHDLRTFSTFGDNGQMHRPHSVAHFSLPKNTKYEQNGNLQPEKYHHQRDAARLAVSQPILAIGRHSSYRKHGPIDRPDIFYQGSLMNIPSYRSRLDLKHGERGAFIERRSSLSYRRRKHEDEEEERSKLCGVIPCSAETKDTLNEMLDVSLFRDVLFVLFTISNFLTSIGFNIPYVFLVPKALKAGLTDDEASMIIAIIGAANTVGRVILGYISDKPWVNRLMVYNWALTICGAATIAGAFCDTFLSMAIYASVFGFTIGAYVGLTSVILVDLLGLDKLTNAFGLLLLFQGIASLVGPPIAGALAEATGDYNCSFYLAGITVAFSGMILFIIPVIQRYQSRKSEFKSSLEI